MLLDYIPSDLNIQLLFGLALGVLFGIITMGQILCLPMIAGGIYLLMRERRI